MVTSLRRSALLVCLLALLLPSGGARADGPLYTVRSGDALSVLAERFDVTTDDLREWNEIEGDEIQIGQRLRVAAEGRAPANSGPTLRVRPGQTLSHVAREVGATVEQLIELNDGLRPDRVRAGQELRVPGTGRRVDYVVQRGDRLGRIAARFGVSVRDLVRWNSGLDPERLRYGRTVHIFTEVRESVSESVGRPHRGNLLRAERLRPHPGYFIRNRHRSWGTLETMQWLHQGFDAVREAHPGGPRVRLHDISLRRGGRMEGHRSHQSGRDVDLSYYQRRCGGQPCPMRRIGGPELDLDRQWTLLKRWLENDQLEAVFMDYSLQRPLYEHARSHGATRRQLHRWFQYPRGPSYALGTIRHFRNHRDHLHVRFICPETDRDCR